MFGLAKLAAAHGGMAKTAQARWRQLIDSAQDHRQLSNIFSEFNRNRWVPGWGNPAEKTGINDVQDVDRLRTPIKQFLSQYTQHKQVPWATKPVSELTPSELMERKMYVRGKSRARGGYQSMDIDTGHGPEDLLPIIHGTNRAKAEAFLRGGNGAVQVEGTMNLGDGVATRRGINVHSARGDRAKHYAEGQVLMRGGEPVILEGQIQRKYLFPNPTRYAGGGDEYAIPSQYYDKIQKPVIRPV